MSDTYRAGDWAEVTDRNGVAYLCRYVGDRDIAWRSVDGDWLPVGIEATIRQVKWVYRDTE